MQRIPTKPATIVVAAMALASVAAPAAAGKGPTYAEIPVSQTVARPAASAKPKSIPARETVAGLKTKVVENDAVVMIDGKSNGKMPDRMADVAGCVSLGRSTSTEWDAPIEIESHHTASTGVVPIRAEKLVDASDGSRLEITDVWFDTRSRGLRAIGKSTVALKTYTTLPGGTRILAGRDEHGGKKMVQFVVAEAKDKPVNMLTQVRTQTTRVGPESKQDRLGVCSHHRFAVTIGESVSFQTKLVLPDLGPNEKTLVVNTLPALNDFEKQSHVKDVRVREVRISVGLSQTSHDKEPVISVATEWSSDESFERVYAARDLTPTSHVFQVEPSEDDAMFRFRTLF